MSADNELAIVHFAADTNIGESYRWTEIRGCPSETDLTFISDYYEAFQLAIPYETFDEVRSKVEDWADLIEERGGILEYGVTFYKSPHPLSFYDPNRKCLE